MGNGDSLGNVILINATPWHWTRNSSTQSQMTTWNPPADVPPGSLRVFPVAFSVNVVRPWQDSADAEYEISTGSTTYQVTLQARSSGTTNQTTVHGIHLQYSTAFRGIPAGTTYTLGTIATTTVSSSVQLDFGVCCISGTDPAPGALWGHIVPPNWMTQVLPLIGDLTIGQICLPFSHDAGMGGPGLSWTSPLSTVSNTKTQDLDILGQLNAGAHFFDLRPCLSDGRYHAAHLKLVVSDWQGAFGQDLEDVCNQINVFTSNSSNSELLIFELSHAYVKYPGSGPFEFLPMVQSQYNALFEYISSRVQHLFQYQSYPANLTNLPLKEILSTNPNGDIISPGHPAVIFTVSDEGVLGESITVPSDGQKGFYYGCISGQGTAKSKGSTMSQLYYNGIYSNSDIAKSIETDQLEKLSKYCPGPTSPPFLAYYTLTLRFSDIASGRSIQYGSRQIQSLLYQNLWGNMNPNKYPNLIGTDFIRDRIASFAMAINVQFAQNTPYFFTHKVEMAWYGVDADVTSFLSQKYRDHFYPASGEPAAKAMTPYSFVVNNTNLGLDPNRGGEVLGLKVILSRSNRLNPASRTLQYFTANPGETIGLDPRNIIVSVANRLYSDIINNILSCGGVQTMNVGIMCATYGPVDARSLTPAKDVTDLVQSIWNTNAPSLVVNNDTMGGDSAPDEYKFLRVLTEHVLEADPSRRAFFFTDTMEGSTYALPVHKWTLGHAW